MVLNFSEDTSGYKHVNKSKSRQELLDISERMELIDVWRISHTSDRRYICRSGKKGQQQARLDFFSLVLAIYLNEIKPISKYDTEETIH